MIPTPAAAAAGSTRSSGLSRNALRMICTDGDAAGGRWRVSAWSTVSTLTPYAAIEPSSTSASSASYVASSSIDRRRRAVQLHEVERSMPRLRPRAVDPRAEVVGRVVLRHLLDAAAHLGGDREARVRVLGEEAADELLAAAVAVDVGGVEEGDARLRRRLEHVPGVGLGDLAPVGAELPGAEPDHRDVAAGPAEGAVLHSLRGPGRAGSTPGSSGARG